VVNFEAPSEIAQASRLFHNVIKRKSRSKWVDSRMLNFAYQPHASGWDALISKSGVTVLRL